MFYRLVCAYGHIWLCQLMHPETASFLNQQGESASLLWDTVMQKTEMNPLRLWRRNPQNNRKKKPSKVMVLFCLLRTRFRLLCVKKSLSLPAIATFQSQTCQRPPAGSNGNTLWRDHIIRSRDPARKRKQRKRGAELGQNWGGQKGKGGRGSRSNLIVS